MEKINNEPIVAVSSTEQFPKLLGLLLPLLGMLSTVLYFPLLVTLKIITSYSSTDNWVAGLLGLALLFGIFSGFVLLIVFSILDFILGDLCLKNNKIGIKIIVILLLVQTTVIVWIISSFLFFLVPFPLPLPLIISFLWIYFFMVYVKKYFQKSLLITRINMWLLRRNQGTTNVVFIALFLIELLLLGIVFRVASPYLPLFKAIGMIL